MKNLKKNVLKQMTEMKKLGCCGQKAITFVRSGKFDENLKDMSESCSMRTSEIVDMAIRYSKI